MAGNAGNAGNSGGVGAVGNGAPMVFLPDRVDLPFVTVDDPPGQPIAGQRVTLATYPDRAWTSEWRAWNALSEYAATDWATDIVVDPWPNTTAQVEGEIRDLVLAARDERADALDEILAQNDEFASYFMGLLTIRPTGYPLTCRLIDLASIVATFTVLHFKGGAPANPATGYPGYAVRPRPSHICPALLPPVQVPGHPAYPSGHATQSQLIALVLNDVLAGSAQAAPMAADLRALAWRIARNREIAGLHYPSDSHTGRQLAAKILPILQGIKAYTDVIAGAKAEWT